MKIPEYKNLKEKENVFGCDYRRIDTVADLLGVIGENKASEGKKVFRGICEAKYKNYTSAQRKYIVDDFSTRNITLETIIQNEIDELSRHKMSRSKNIMPRYYESLGVIPNDVLYLSFAQHYGAISPLLDFTRNVNIALYMMLKGCSFPSTGGNDIDNYCSVYCLKVDEYNQTITNSNKKQVVNSLKFENLSEVACPLVITDKAITIKGEKEKNIISFSNLNIIRQEGCFVFYFDKKNPIQPLENELFCIDIHKSLATHIHESMLNPKGIIGTYLFPNEEDIAKNALRDAIAKL